VRRLGQIYALLGELFENEVAEGFGRHDAPLTGLRLLFSGFDRFFRWQQAGELLVTLEQKLHALRVAGERGFAVAGVYRRIQFLVCFYQRSCHIEPLRAI
jgi:hypothetical protein